MKKIAALLSALMLLFLLVFSVSAANRSALNIYEFLNVYENRSGYYALLGAQWDSGNWTLLKKEGNIGYFECDGLLMTCETFEDAGGNGKNLSVNAVGIKYNEVSGPDKRPGLYFLILALISSLEHPEASSEEDLYEARKVADGIYAIAQDKYKTFQQPQSGSIKVHTGKNYSYSLVYVDSYVPDMFFAEAIERP